MGNFQNKNFEQPIFSWRKRILDKRTTHASGTPYTLMYYAYIVMYYAYTVYYISFV